MALREAGLGALLACAAVMVPQTLPASPGNYLSTDEFLETAFAGAEPLPARLIIDSGVRAEIEEILGHEFARLRLRYWEHGGITAWVLEEVGKTEPITIGVAVEAGRVRSVRVLTFRESRGWEIRHPFFTDQFRGAMLHAGRGLDRPIDGITGATLSVAAMNKVVRIALLLDGRVRAAREAPTIARN
jgi:hypothetical protein